MKTAVCLFGQPKLYQNTYPILKQTVLDINDVDIFGHAWDNGDPNLKMDLDSRYNFKSLLIEPQAAFNNRPIIDFTNTLSLGYAKGSESFENGDKTIFRNFSKWYSVLQSYIQCVKYSATSGQKYDCIAFVRYDSYPVGYIKFDQYDMQYAWGEIAGTHKELVLDWFNFGGPYCMSKYATVYFELERIFKETNIWTNEYFTRRVMDEIQVITQPLTVGLVLETHRLNIMRNHA